MKKIFLALLMASLLAVPFLGLAQSIMPNGNDASVGTGLNVNMVNKPIANVLGTVANYVIGVLLIVAVFYVLWAAYTFMTSAGEADKVSEARKRIMYAGIGVVVALLAKGIISLVLNAVNSSN
jgi:hypothetical protein